MISLALLASSNALDYAVEMAARVKTELELSVKDWIRTNPKEETRLEFKQLLDLSNAALKAEFVRDVISLANSEGEFPRKDGYLVIGYRDGVCYDVSNAGHDGAKFAQILDSLISPPVTTAYQEFDNEHGGRIGVLTISPNCDVLCIVKRELRDGSRVHLQTGQSWGRRSAGKNELSGDDIQSRLAAIVDRRIEEETNPYIERITRLERESGPALEVKRIRFAMQATRDWDEVEDLLKRLAPYGHEFDHHVKQEVLDVVHAATARVRYGMTLGAFQAVDSLLEVVMPRGNGGTSRPSREPFSKEEQELLERVESAAFEMTWDACRYVRNIDMVKTAAHRYWYLIRITKLNGPKYLQERTLKNARYCQQICREREEAPFTEAEKLLAETIKTALDLSW